MKNYIFNSGFTMSKMLLFNSHNSNLMPFDTEFHKSFFSYNVSFNVDHYIHSGLFTYSLISKSTGTRQSVTDVPEDITCFIKGTDGLTMQLLLYAALSSIDCQTKSRLN